VVTAIIHALAAGGDESEFAERTRSLLFTLALDGMDASNESIGEGWPARKLPAAPAIPAQADKRLTATIASIA
jgi:hypothetical protein